MANEVSSQHPDYVKILPDWNLVRDAMDGETVVKEKGDEYLPMPDGFTSQEDKGVKMYNAYRLRAKFPEILDFTIRGMVGIIHRVPTEITVPKQLEPMIERATRDGLPLQALHERITTELLATGRYGLLTDVPMEGDPTPYIAGYTAENILNWSADLDFYVLDESHLKRKKFEWKITPQYRVLEIKPVLTDEEKAEAEAEAQGEEESAERASIKEGTYFQTLYKVDASGELKEQIPVIPQARGGSQMIEIPFVVAGTTDVAVSIDQIPLLTIARCAFAMYRLDADYKWQLFMSGQETFVTTGAGENEIDIIGAGVHIQLPAGADAKYVGPSGEGINAQKEAIQDERQQAVMAGARMFDADRKAAESGDALRIRYAAQTATLSTIAINSSKALEKALKFAAIFVGANPDEVSVKPNLQFVDTQLDPQKAEYIMKLWLGGAISGMTMWEYFQRGELVTKDRTWEEEQELINQEMPDVAPPASDPIPKNADNPNPGEGNEDLDVDDMSGQGQV